MGRLLYLIRRILSTVRIRKGFPGYANLDGVIRMVLAMEMILILAQTPVMEWSQPTDLDKAQGTVLIAIGKSEIRTDDFDGIPDSSKDGFQLGDPSKIGQ